MTPSRSHTKSGPDRTLIAVVACFVLSGFAALLYQTVWMREFSILFGTSELAIVTVLAAYMGGLALGAAIAGRHIRSVTRPILFYGVLELGVAIGALLVPAGFWLVQKILVAVLGGQPELTDSGGLGRSLFFLLFGFVILAIPTAFMGATLPVLMRHVVRSTEEIGRRTGLLYAMNTLGAVFGTLSCAFLFLPSLGLFGTTLIGVGLNVLIFLIAIRISPVSAEASANAGEAETGAPVRPAEVGVATENSTIREPLSPWRGSGVILPLIAISGAISFTYEVLWTRLLAHILGTSVYSFATMLATFLTGITVGSAVASRFARDARTSGIGFIVAQLGTAVSGLFVFAMLDQVPSIASAWSAGEQASLAVNALTSGLVLFPTTLFIGATFPFAVRILARDEDDAAPGSARVYAWNTTGAIVGSVLTGFFLVPGLQFTGTVALAVAVNLGLGVTCAALLVRIPPKMSFVLAGAGLVIVFLFFPSRPEKLLLMSPVAAPAEGKVIYSGVGPSATVLLLERRLGDFQLRTNGLPEAFIARKGAPPLGEQANWWLGALPPLAFPEAKSMLVIGLGGGVVIEGVPDTIETIDVIELEPRVETANRLISDRRRTDPLADPRVRLIYNDARGALALTDKRWDIVISQPSHPWTAGASHLYTREFMEQIRSHLTEDGIFCQGYLDESILGMVGATLLEAFPNVELYCPGSYLYLAANRPLNLLGPESKSPSVIASDPTHYAWLGVHNRADLAPGLVLTEEGVRQYCENSPVITDDRNRLATAPPHLVRTDRSPNDRNPRLDQFDPYQSADKNLNWVTKLGLPGPYLVRRLAGMGFTHRAARIAEALADPGDRELARLLLQDSSSQDSAHLEALIATYPDHSELLYYCLLKLAANGRPPTLDEVKRLDVPSRAALRAKTADAQWENISTLEDALAAARSNQLAFEQACYYRAAWRVGFGTEEARNQRGAEALQIIDDLVAIYPQARYYLARMIAAERAQRPHVVVESGSAIADSLARNWNQLAEDSRVGMARSTLESLDRAKGITGVPEDRRTAIVRRLRGMIGE